MAPTAFSVLFVCTGNICRSPAAEGMFRHRIRELGIETQFRHDSAGVADYHIGEAPDVRSQHSLALLGARMDNLRARQVTRDDFYTFDLILGMDGSHVRALKKMAPADATAEVALYLDYAQGQAADVPDPYYGDRAGFDAVSSMIDRATTALLEKLQRR